MADRYTNIRVILDKIMRHPLLSDITLETVVDYTIDFMRIVGTPSIFEERVDIVEVKNYRAVLPCELYQIIQVRRANCERPTFRYSTDSFHLSECKHDCNPELTYKVQGDIIYTSIKEGEIEVAYKAILTDEGGFPVIPDNSSFTRALQAYIKKEWFTILFDLGKLNGQVLQKADQEYAWAVGDCQTEFNRLTIDKAESFYNSWKTMIIRDTEHSYGFIHNGTKERLRNQ